VTCGDGVFVPSSAGARVTRLPDKPVLGRKARARRVAELRAEVGRNEAELLELAARRRQLAGAVETVDRVRAAGLLYERADPTAELDEARGALERTLRQARQLQKKLRDVDGRVERTADHRRALAALLPDADLLDPPDYAVATAELEGRLAEARAARRWLRTHAGALATVRDGLDILRAVPPTVDEVAAMAAELQRCRVERDALALGLSALRDLESNPAALGWHDAPSALASQKALRPALDEQVRRADAELAAAQSADEAARTAYETASAAALAADGRCTAVDEALARDAEELAAVAVDDASTEALAAVRSALDDLNGRVAALDGEERAAQAAVAEAGFRLQGARDRVVELRRARDDEERQLLPLNDRWQRFQTEAAAAGVLASALLPAVVERARTQGSINLFVEARSSAGLLAERLVHADGGADLGRAIETALRTDSQDVALDYLRTWLDAREWLRCRVPHQVAEVDSPLEALARVRDHLARLQESLARHEGNLRGQSEDVARNIETHRRKARREIERLNEGLRNVRFGSIVGVKIKVHHVEQLDRILQALREGDTQGLLFQTAMPVEEAMASLFKRYAGGTTGGQRLLDYREYLELQVQVKRQAGTDWETANPTRMSTGEAIGVGAAIMMVVLTSWELHANLLRTRRSSGTLRLLFLDEANRLSQDNLVVLFELCQNLDLQLIIAAPEVARAEGNTTYHLVRQVDEGGREIVRVTGRRTLRTDAA